MKIIYILWLLILFSTVMLSSLLITAPDTSIYHKAIFIISLIVAIALIILTPKPSK